jgi:hypothetical protein
MASEETINEPHGDLRILVTPELTIELKTLEPQREALLVFWNRLSSSLNDFEERSGVKGRSTCAVNMREMHSQQLVEDGKTIAAIRLLTDNSTEDRRRRRAVACHHRKDSMQSIAKCTMRVDPVSANGPFGMITIRHNCHVHRRSS